MDLHLYAGQSPYPTGEDLLDSLNPAARVWVPESPILVLGHSQDPETELHLDAVRAGGVPVYKRRGGGGAVYLDPGCVCVAIRFPKRADWGIHDYFGAGNALMARALAGSCGIDARPRGISDLAVVTGAGPRKISGSSLYLPRECALFLASVLVSAPLADWDRFLRHPSREPDYREGRRHAEFVVNLSDLRDLREGVTVERVKEAMEREVSGKSRGS